MNDTVGSWGARNRPAAVSITFDNLGEAAEIALGIWDESVPYGNHYTATKALPKLLQLIDGISTTYFIEGINAEIYPDQVRQIHDTGVEVGLHGYCHEAWNRIGKDRQIEVLDTAEAAMEAIGIHCVGYRPPGGEASLDAQTMLAQRGYEYCSPLDFGATRLGEPLAVLPFQWRYVDAFMVDPLLNSVRYGSSGPLEPITPQAWLDDVDIAIDKLVENGAHGTFVLHPYLFGDDPAYWRSLETFVSKLRGREDIWLASCKEIVDWMQSGN